MEIFEYASRNKLRFASVRGELTVEQLWDTPLRSRDDFNLDIIARGVNRGKSAASEESFVETTKNPAQERLSTALEVVKHVIATKLAEEQAAQQRVENRAELKKRIEALKDYRGHRTPQRQAADRTGPLLLQEPVRPAVRPHHAGLRL